MFFHLPSLTGLSSTLTKGIYGFTAYSFGMKKLSDYLNTKGQMVEFRKLSETVDQLNRKMKVISYSLEKLIKAEMRKRNEDDDLESERKRLREYINNNLKEINKEEQTDGETMKLIEMQMKEEENDWLIIDNHNKIKRD